MASFTSVPDDVLLEILLQLQHDRQDLIALTLSSRRIHPLARRILYRHVGNLPKTRRKLLVVVLEKDPDLRNYVQSCTPIVVDENGGVESESLGYASLFPNLVELHLIRKSSAIAPDDGSSDLILKTQRKGTSYQCEFLDTLSLKSLKEIRLDAGHDAGPRETSGFTVTEILRCMQHASLRTLEVCQLGDLDSTIAVSPLSPKSSITSLKLVGSLLWSVRHSLIRTLLGSCTQLKRLHCQIPMVTRANAFGPTRLVEDISPAALRDMLEPVRQTLQELHLINRPWGVTYDESKLDLSDFTLLEILQVPSPCLLPPGRPNEGRKNLHYYLPPRIRHIHVGSHLHLSS
jgi:hypothetical protein